MLHSRCIRLVLLCVAVFGAPFASPAAADRLAVAWNDPAANFGVVRAIDTVQPWGFATEALHVGRNPILRSAHNTLFAVSPTNDSITAVDPQTWTIRQVFDLPAGLAPTDIAVVDPHTAYVSFRNATQLYRLDLDSGISTPVIDLSRFADGDGIPDLNMMTLHENRLFVQIQRRNTGAQIGYVPPSYLAVVDIPSEQLIDVDPVAEGVQAIELSGTFAKHKMQVVEPTRELFVSATGGFFDEGGIEVIDLDTYQSKGLAIAEADDEVGADLGPFVMVAPNEGFLAYSTDLTISSHLHRFSRDQGVEPAQLHVAVDFLTPTLVFDSVTNQIFFPMAATPNPAYTSSMPPPASS